MNYYNAFDNCVYSDSLKKKKAQSNLDGGIKHERNYNYNTIISIYERKRISFNCKRLDP